ncbi:unnamed protein product [Gadus morhua 'NCC']
MSLPFLKDKRLLVIPSRDSVTRESSNQAFVSPGRKNIQEVLKSPGTRWSLDSTCFDLSDLVRTMKPIEAYHNSAVCDIEASLKISVWKAPLDSWFDSYRGRAVRPPLVVLLRASRALQEEKRRCSLMDFCSSCHLIERDMAPLEPAHDQYQPQRPPPRPPGVNPPESQSSANPGPKPQTRLTSKTQLRKNDPS